MWVVRKSMVGIDGQEAKIDSFPIPSKEVAERLATQEDARLKKLKRTACPLTVCVVQV